VVIADFRGRVVLVTGGTMGVGLATALAFGARGAVCWLTYRWGSADENALYARFAEAGAPVPKVVQADAARADDTDALLAEMRTTHAQVDVLID
jgi:3-oxoacyl-[acyl-carrier protein] reductase